MKKAYVLLFDGYSDWEIGYILPELSNMGNAPAIAAGFSGKPVRSMGGLTVQPETRLCDVDPDDVLIFILPGGAMWEGDYPRPEIEAFLLELDKRKTPIAAICGATTALARAGLLDDKKHTSNSLKYLCDQAPDYSGKEHYVDELAVTGGHVTTASGLGSVEFTLKIMEALSFATPELLASWFRAFKYGEYPEGPGAGS